MARWAPYMWRCKRVYLGHRHPAVGRARTADRAGQVVGWSGGWAAGMGEGMEAGQRPV